MKILGRIPNVAFAVFHSFHSFILTGALGSFFISVYCHLVVYKFTCGSFFNLFCCSAPGLSHTCCFFFSHIIKNRNVRYYFSAFLLLRLLCRIFGASLVTKTTLPSPTVTLTRLQSGVFATDCSTSNS